MSKKKDLVGLLFGGSGAERSRSVQPWFQLPAINSKLAIYAMHYAGILSRLTPFSFVWGVRKGGWGGGGGILGRDAKFTRDCHGFFLHPTS